MLPFIALGSALINGVSGWFERKQELKKAEHENRVRMLKSEQDHNHEWEMKQLSGAGWKDDVLFYCIIGLWVWSAIDPDSASRTFKVWENIMPDYIREITSWVVGGVLGVKKLGDYLPGAMKAIKSAVKD